VCVCVCVCVCQRERERGGGVRENLFIFFQHVRDDHSLRIMCIN
jgi:hypothetical protein